ncbi:glycoside hydrolase 43 family protein [Arenibacter sp. GZD96]|uniref:glycoside hydrolase family 43 protein n=1 Tax=Aurantibrevibacter litoralis TaxID=3106030 RepID=UPI002AFDF3A6|nr:glycoside hydrolase 43 family protein [Arenibacter sp. GZD-96]MEA1785161.1 glycoside hydrolase 43 family protein [Arenibacter sp. GZD-96]
MTYKLYIPTFLLVLIFPFSVEAQNEKAHNPILFADVPDLSMIRVADTYYMSSTTMHMSPGLPIMKSKDLVNWELISYAYDTLGSSDELDLNNGKSMYGRGSWASSLRYHKDTFYVSTFSSTTGKTYIFSTKNPEKEPWQKIEFSPSYHDNTIFFDDDGKVYMIWAAGKLHIAELKEDLSGIKEDTDKVLIENASAPAGDTIMLGAEGSQLFKVNGTYYLFNITWPQGGMRTVLIHRADSIMGPWEGKIGLQDLGVAQGGLIDTPDGRWFSYLFRDYGGVGRIPYVVPVEWEDGWPVLGKNGKVPQYLDLPANKSVLTGIAASDDFKRKKNDKDLPLVWQWNHNPNNALWSVRERKGYLRLRTGRIDTSLVAARNTLTQRTLGPVSMAATLLDLSAMKEGDVAGLTLLQKEYGFVGVHYENGVKNIVMINAPGGKPNVLERTPLTQNKIYLKAECNFKDKTDIGRFYYSLNGTTWVPIGEPIKLPYTLPHFMGYRFGLFNYATKNFGGYVDFDYFHISDKI